MDIIALVLLLLAVNTALVVWDVEAMRDDADERWRKIDDLPEDEGEDVEWEERCVISWQDSEHESDQGLELTNLYQIRHDYPTDERILNGRMKDVYWMNLMDSPAF